MAQPQVGVLGSKATPPGPVAQLHAQEGGFFSLEKLNVPAEITSLFAYTTFMLGGSLPLPTPKSLQR